MMDDGMRGAGGQGGRRVTGEDGMGGEGVD